MDSFFCFDHQGKSKPFVDALKGKYEFLPRTIDPKNALFILADHDVLSKRNTLQTLYNQGVRKIFIYPHAGRPSFRYAFFDPSPVITAEFVSTPGHIEIMKTIGHPGKLHAVGWQLCPVREFHPKESIYKVLFAPIHPRNSQIDKDVNLAVMQKLYPLAAAGKICLTVRYLGDLKDNGLYKYNENVIYLEGTAAPAIRDIDVSDVVIAHQTFAYLAVARGIPTVMMGEHLIPHIEFRNKEPIFAKGWEDVKDLVMFPLDILNADDPLEYMRQAALTDDNIKEWKARMIGDPFSPDLFISILESYL